MSEQKRTTSKVLGALKFAEAFHSLLQFDMRISTLHPGGGQYDCFSICDANHALVMLNYAGFSASGSGINVDDGWREIEISPQAIAEKFARGVELEGTRYENDREITAKQIAIYQFFIESIESDLAAEWDLIWGYVDSPEMVEENLPSDFLFPTHWKNLESLSPGMYGWQANVLILTKNREIIAVANQANGEILN
jgi:hypothetical protein